MRSSRAKEKTPLPTLPTPNEWPLTTVAPPAIARRPPAPRASRRAEGAGEEEVPARRSGTGPPEVAPRQMPCEEQLLEPRRHPQPQDAGRWRTQFVGSVMDLR